MSNAEPTHAGCFRGLSPEEPLNQGVEPTCDGQFGPSLFRCAQQGFSWASSIVQTNHQELQLPQLPRKPETWLISELEARRKQSRVKRTSGERCTKRADSVQGSEATPTDANLERELEALRPMSCDV